VHHIYRPAETIALRKNFEHLTFLKLHQPRCCFGPTPAEIPLKEYGFGCFFPNVYFCAGVRLLKMFGTSTNKIG
jgi:hypothetical protein